MASGSSRPWNAEEIYRRLFGIGYENFPDGGEQKFIIVHQGSRVLGFFKTYFFPKKRQHRLCSKTPKVCGRSVSMFIKNLNVIGNLVWTVPIITCDFSTLFFFFLNGCNDFTQKLITSELGQYPYPQKIWMWSVASFGRNCVHRQTDKHTHKSDFVQRGIEGFTRFARSSN